MGCSCGRVVNFGTLEVRCFALKPFNSYATFLGGTPATELSRLPDLSNSRHVAG